MAGGGGGGGGGGAPRPPGGRRQRHQAAWLPLEVMADIAARSDPVTLVRCAATCGDLRGRVADPGFRRRLRLRHADRFVPSLLRGHLVGEPDFSIRIPDLDDDPLNVYLVDAATATLLPAAESFPPGPDGEPLLLYRSVSAREGLVLVECHELRLLRVCNLATGRSQTLPPVPAFLGYYALLVGDGEGGAVGRPFQVVKASLVFHQFQQSQHRLLVQTFSSELGVWGPCTEIRTPQIQGRQTCQPKIGRLLVVGDAVYWLCLTSSAGYVLKIRVRAAAAPRLTVTKLPERYPYNGGWRINHLLATMAPGGGSPPAVLVADMEKISAWTQSRHTARWNPQPHVVIRYDAISRFLDSVGEGRLHMHQAEQVNLVWFAQRSGIVFIRMYNCFFWLDLQSKEIVRCSSDPEIRYKDVYDPCEMDLSTWVPTFSSI
ncbi:unnamed protein product [Urochloa decumbens]|uniref:DUF7595 domain-containing protein n=1 Tax=Urochloa decumbens TaxID=240449 RepID=A0ABC9G242_9POAL